VLLPSYFQRSTVLFIARKFSANLHFRNLYVFSGMNDVRSRTNFSFDSVIIREPYFLLMSCVLLKLAGMVRGSFTPKSFLQTGNCRRSVSVTFHKSSKYQDKSWYNMTFIRITQILMRFCKNSKNNCTVSNNHLACLGEILFSTRFSIFNTHPI